MVKTEVKNRLIDKIEQISDPKIIHEIYRLLSIDVDEDEYQTTDAQKKALDAALSEVEEGKTMTENEANKQTAEWFNNKR